MVALTVDEPHRREAFILHVPGRTISITLVILTTKVSQRFHLHVALSAFPDLILSTLRALIFVLFNRHGLFGVHRVFKGAASRGLRFTSTL